jgi:DNA-binding CsgD family transcriptional regulator/tetratricopeptide (TPR) repeat protein
VEDVGTGIAVQSQWPLTGRNEQLDQITAVLRSHFVSIVVLTGESGVGKSRLAAESAATLTVDGWAIIRVAASAMLTATPLGALIPAISPGRDAIDVVVRDSLAIFDLVRESINRLAKDNRVIMIVDDFSLLDPLSMTVIIQLVAANVVRLIATVPSGESLPDAFVSMWTDDSALVLEVLPLSIADVETLLNAVLGARVAHRTAVAFHERSGGNVLFLRELVIGAVQDDQLQEHDGVWQLLGKPLGTPALHDLIRTRLQHLSAPETALIERLAVCHPLTLDDLPADARESLVSLERAGLVIVEERRGRTWLSLSHPQYAEAVRGSMSRLATVDLLVDQAALVAERDMSPEDELRVALWRLDAGVESDPAILFRATHLAVLGGDHPRAEHLAAAAIEAGAPPAEMLLLQGQSIWTLGRIAEALAILDRAALEDEAHPTTVKLTGQIASTRASVFAGETDGNSLGLAVIDRAIERHPELSVTLAFPKSVLLLNLEDAALSELALQVATPAPDADETEHAAFDLGQALPLSALGQVEPALLAARAAVAHSTESLQPAFALRRAQMVLETVLLQVGRLEEAREVAVRSLEACIDADDELGTRYNELLLGQCYLGMGQLDTAGRWLSDVISGSQARGSVFYLDQARSLLALTLLWRGRPGEAAAILADLDQKLVASSSIAALSTLWLDAVRGGRDRALAGMLRRARAAADRGHVVLAASLLHAASRLGAAAQAASQLTSLASGTTSELLKAQVAHAAAEAAGDLDALVRVADRWESMGYILFAGEALVSASGAARRAHNSRVAISLQNRADDLLARCEGAATPLLQFAERGERLTGREREIAALAAQGLSSLEIAKRLQVSPRTVNNHLHAAYSKLGVRGRNEL